MLISVCCAKDELKAGMCEHSDNKSDSMFALCPVYTSIFLSLSLTLPKARRIRQIEKLRFLGISHRKFKLRFWLGVRRRKSFSPAAAARHQGRSQRMRGEIQGFIYPGENLGVYLSGILIIYSWINPRNFLHMRWDLP